MLPETETHSPPAPWLLCVPVRCTQPPSQLRLQLEPHNISLSQDMVFLLVKNTDWETALSFLLTYGHTSPP